MKPGVELVLRVGSATLVIGAIGFFIGSLQAGARKHAPAPSAAPAAHTASPGLEPPIDGEARMFEAATTEPVKSSRRATAHPRTLATYRALRPFPGAPPRVPHGLTAEEFRGTRCRTCHERGGYSMRFEAYAPVTPHPELTDCLQCHVADDAVVGITLPNDAPDALCRQCHAPGVVRVERANVDGRGAPWPVVQPTSSTDPPPPIPHELTLRSNCVACHAGPGAVQEIRTSHPERASCLQCHVTTSAAPPFKRGQGAP